MKKIIFGKTGLKVSRIAFGGIPIMRLPAPAAIEVIKESLELGVNFIDTATGYTDSQVKIGLAIGGLPRQDLVLATKSGADDKKIILEHIDNSLKQLKTDYIDIYQLHGVSTEERFKAVMGENGAYEGLMLAVKQGKVRFAGFSSHTMSIAKKMLLTEKFFSIQIPYNFIDRQAEEEVLPLAKKMNIGIIAMKPLGGGLLDNAKLCFKFLLQTDGIVPDPGIEKLGEMKEIAEIVEKYSPLTEAELKEIDKIRGEAGKSWCHRCDYCQPCKQGISISTVLVFKSFIKRMPFDRVSAMANEQFAKAAKCTECGDCAGRCPYNLNIPKLLKQSKISWNEYVEKRKGS
ncbi:MAG: aldo/keto reductase [Candidatus Firestonebacteria bacterium]